MKSRFLTFAMTFSFAFLILGWTANAQNKTTDKKEVPKKQTVVTHTKSLKMSHFKTSPKTHKTMTSKKSTLMKNEKKMTSKKSEMMKKTGKTSKRNLKSKAGMTKMHTKKMVKKEIPKEKKKEGNNSSGNGK